MIIKFEKQIFYLILIYFILFSVPTCITTLNKVSFTNSSITLNLSETKNSFDQYKSFLQDQFGNISEILFSKKNTTVDFLNLEAGVEYKITLLTVRGTLESEPCNSKITARTSKFIRFSFFNYFPNFSIWHLLQVKE